MAYFHGTDAVLEPGEVLVPGDTIGKDNFPGMDNSWGVWVSPLVDLAAAYGAHVYEVEPLTAVIDWAEENGWDRDDTNNEFVTTKARVIRMVR